MSESESNDETTRAEIDQENGLNDQDTSWSQWWLIQGVAFGLLFPAIQLLAHEPHPLLIVGFVLYAGGVLYFTQIATNRAFAGIDRRSTGLQHWEKWQYPAIVGIVALLGALIPVLPMLKAEGGLYFMLVAFGSMFGVAYLYIGLLLNAYQNRKAEHYAFYGGGLWILILTVALANIPALRGWSIAALGLGIALYHLCSSLYLR